MAWFNPNWNPNWNRNSSVPSYSAPQGQPLTPQLVIRGFQPPPTTTHYSIMVHLNMAGFTFPAPQHRQQSYAPPGMQQQGPLNLVHHHAMPAQQALQQQQAMQYNLAQHQQRQQQGGQPPQIPAWQQQYYQHPPPQAHQNAYTTSFQPNGNYGYPQYPYALASRPWRL